MPTRFTAEKTAAAIEALSQLRDQQVTLARSWAQEFEQVPPEYRPSALNLLHYLALRQHDLWPLQRDLSSLGLSSLGRTAEHELAGVDAVLAALHKLTARTMERPDGFELPVNCRPAHPLRRRQDRGPDRGGCGGPSAGPDHQSPRRRCETPGRQGHQPPRQQSTRGVASEQDLAQLDFAVACADMVGLSFVRSPEDVLNLERELDCRKGSHLGIVLKVETRAAFEQLPNLLLTALRSPPVGVMVARGDLAVEMGFERLAEVQEQILWLCEAAHVPVIWATQVLESLAKKGLPSRAEVTDAAMSGRAECVMLNKGPHVLNAVRFLDNVMTRMQTHQTKKRAMLRKLSVSDRIVDTHPVRTTDRNGV